MGQFENRRIALALIADYRSVSWDDSAVLHDHGQSRIYSGAEAVCGLLRTVYDEGFSEVRTDIHRVVADASGAAVECTVRGRHSGAFAGIRPTGREVELPMVFVCEIREGRIACADLFYDTGTLLRQLQLAL